MKKLFASHDFELTPLDGGPLECPLEHIADFFRVGEMQDECVQVGVRLKAPAGGKLVAEFDRTKLEHHGDSSEQYLEASTEDRHGGKFERLCAALANGQVPDGTLIDFLNVPGQRYRGTVENKVWKITETHPKLRTDTLRKAVTLARQMREGQPLEAQSEEIARQAHESATKTLDFTQFEWVLEGCSLDAKNQQGERDDTWHAWLARKIFIRTPEFQAVWDLQKALQEDREEEEDDEDDNWVAGLQASLGSHLLKSSGVQLGERVLTGKTGVEFFQADVTDHAHVTPEDVEEADRWMAEIGFRPLGDVTSPALSGSVFRGYVDDRLDCYGTVNSSAMGFFAFDFYNELQNGDSLTTTTMPGAAPKGNHRQELPLADLRELLEKHRSYLEKHPGRPVEPSIEGLARSLDEFLAKSLR